VSTVGILADDLTGALDAGVGFRGAFSPVDFLPDPSDAGRCGSVALNSGSRDMPGVDDAVRATLDLMGLISDKDIVFKKIDSLLRGHAVAEIAAIMRHGGFERCLLAPAFPDQGRVTKGGRQWLMAADGRATPVGPDMSVAFAAAGIAAAVLSPDSERPPERAAIWIGDASTAAELAALARRMAGRGRVLYCGTAGLARVLGGGVLRWPLPLPGPAVMVIGSPHPVTQRQVARLLESAMPAAASADIVVSAERGDLEAVGIAGGHCLLRPRLPTGITVPVAARQVGALLAAHLPARSPVPTLMVAGGETLAQVVATIGARRLRMLGEIEPGVPVSRVVGGGWEGGLLVSKSGAFGDDDLLARLFGLAASEAR